MNSLPALMGIPQRRRSVFAPMADSRAAENVPQPFEQPIADPRLTALGSAISVHHCPLLAGLRRSPAFHAKPRFLT